MHTTRSPHHRLTTPAAAIAATFALALPCAASAAELRLIAPVSHAPAHAADSTPSASLNALLAEAIRNSPEVRAARQEREAALQRIAPAGALDDPMLEAGILNLPTTSPGFNREDMTMKMLGLSQRFPYPGKRDLKRDVARLDSQAVDYAYAETVNRVVRDTRTAYTDLALAIASMRFVDQNRAIVQQLIKIADNRYSVGLGSQVDVLRAQSQLSRMSEELLKLQRDYDLFSAELGHALGRAGAAGVVPAVLELNEVPLDFAALRDRAFEARPQLLALRKLAERNQRSIDVARTARYPDFDVRFSYGQRDSMPDGTRRSDLVSVTVAMNLPVWGQAKTQPRIAEAVAMQEQAAGMAEAQAHETYRKLHQQIATAEQSLKAARLYRNEITPQARLTVEAATAAYQVGRGEFALLLDNQMSVLNAQLAESAAIASYNKALAEIDLITARLPAGIEQAAHGATK